MNDEGVIRVEPKETALLVMDYQRGVLDSLTDAAEYGDRRTTDSRGACADRDRDVHETLLQKVVPRQADVVTLAELGRYLPETT